MINVLVYRLNSNEEEGTATYAFDAKTEVVRVGRAIDNEIVLDNPQVSKYHAKIAIDGKKLVLYDLDSTNGVRIVSIMSSRQVSRARLKNGDSIEIGDYILQVYYRFVGNDEQSTKKRELQQLSTNRKFSNDALRVFIGYSHKDIRFRDQLETHLKALERQGIISTWSDRLLMAGDGYSSKVNANLESSDILLLLVSAHFVASKYCYDFEMTRALELHNKGTTRIIPIIIRDCDWKHTPFATIEVLPTGGKPIDRWPTRDAGWSDAVRGIRQVSEELRKKRSVLAR